ncbi:thiamine pyrophosphate-dependent enzyme [Klebsiella pneumoniae subsp. pneumoniae]|nr:thiamine pyrophosphate-dependent enzyme [Klebsiella pneumoniae subsp. pneumoniae]
MPRAITRKRWPAALGEALPIALGLQLARREELIIAAVGDGRTCSPTLRSATILRR